MTMTKMVLGMFIYSPFNHMTQLLAREYFVEKVLSYNMLMQNVFKI